MMQIQLNLQVQISYPVHCWCQLFAVTHVISSEKNSIVDKALFTGVSVHLFVCYLRKFCCIAANELNLMGYFVCYKAAS